MNLSDGGKNITPRRDTFFGPENTPQSMTVRSAAGEEIARGMKSTLQGRGKWREGLNCQCNGYTVEKCPEGRKDCCARRLLSEEPDFKASKETNWILETVQAFGYCNAIFYPKFHCELNYIELIWAYVKKWLRRRCSYSIEDLREKVPLCLKSIPLSIVKKSWQHCSRYMSAYRSDQRLKGPFLDYIMKRYRSHRRIPAITYVDELYLYQEHLQNKERRKYGANAGRYASYDHIMEEVLDTCSVTATVSFPAKSGQLGSLLHVENTTRVVRKSKKEATEKTDKTKKGAAKTVTTAPKKAAQKVATAKPTQGMPSREEIRAPQIPYEPHVTKAGASGIMSVKTDDDRPFMSILSNVYMLDYKWLGNVPDVDVERQYERAVQLCCQENQREWRRFGGYSLYSYDLLRLRTHNDQSVRSSTDLWLNDAVRHKHT